MANYDGKIRTNYFRVKDIDKLRSFAENHGYELHEKEDNYFVLGEYGVGGIEDLEEKELKEFQENLEDGQVVISMEIGNEKLRYLSAFATMISRDKIETIDLFSHAVEIFSEEITDETNQQINY